MTSKNLLLTLPLALLAGGAPGACKRDMVLGDGVPDARAGDANAGSGGATGGGTGGRTGTGGGGPGGVSGSGGRSGGGGAPGTGGLGIGAASGTGGAGTGGAPGAGGSAGARDGGADVSGSGGAGGSAPDAAADQTAGDGAAPDAATCPATAPEITTPCSIAHLSIGPCSYRSTVQPGCIDYFMCECISAQPGVDCRWRLQTRGCPGGPMTTCNPASGAAVLCPGTGLECLGCPAGGDQVVYYCTTACTADSQCTDPARPTCNRRGADGGGDPMSEGICTGPGAECDWNSRCASPETRIATPGGETAIASLRVGDLVLSTDATGRVAAVPIARTTRIAVVGHHVVEVMLRGGARLEVSGGHPTADGRRFADLAPGQSLGGAEIVAVRTVPYRFAHTYDILPASSTGSYFAEGALIGSTLAAPAPRSTSRAAP
jgi:hypothetical protein